MAIVSVYALIVDVGQSVSVAKRFHSVPGWLSIVSIIFCIGNLVSTIALFKWKRWGFYGWAAISIIAITINLITHGGIVSSILGLFSIGILYGVLQIGGDIKGWSQLE